MKNLDISILRESVLSKIQHQYEFPEIENALDEYADSIISNMENENRELLEALEMAVEFIENYGNHRHLHDSPKDCSHCLLIAQARAAIAKATNQAT